MERRSSDDDEIRLLFKAQRLFAARERAGMDLVRFFVRDSRADCILMAVPKG